MQQYIYGNIGHQAYRYESSDPAFFSSGNAHRLSVLEHLTRYDKQCAHGDIPPEQHQCFWLLTTDLDQPGEPERLFVQASGFESHRSSIYAHGYMSDEQDPDLYGPAFLKLLQTHFASGEDILKRAGAGQLPELDWEDVPTDGKLEPAQVDPRLMRNILLALLENRKVILRLPSVGREAMDNARELLLAIYGRLPYEQRRINGCFTGASAATVRDKENPLPAAVTIILMDGDADIHGIISGEDQVFFDCADPGFFPEEVKSFHRPLLDFLTEQPREVLEEYFQSCRKCIREGMNASELKVSDYRMLLDFFNVDRIASTDEQLRLWASNLLSGKWPDSLKKKLREKIAETLPVTRLETYLTGHFQKIEELNTLGTPDRAELDQLKKTGVALQDVNGAMTLRMTELLLPYYPAGTKEQLLEVLTQRFLELGAQWWPCLKEQKPTAKTVSELETLQFAQPSDDKLELTREVKKRTGAELERMRAEVLKRYAQNREDQQNQGLKWIKAWPFEDVQDSFCVPKLYERLQENYLFDELCAGQVWNPEIARKVYISCQKHIPQTVRASQAMLAYEKTGRTALVHNGGSFTPEQELALADSRKNWEGLLALETIKCGDLSQLLTFFDRVDATGLTDGEKRRLKAGQSAKMAGMRPDAEQICNCVDAISRRSEKELLREVVQASLDLAVIYREMEPVKACSRLQDLAKLEKAGLFAGQVAFQPWEEQDTPKRLLERIDAFRCYRRGMPEPAWEQRHILEWLLEMDREHTDLQLLVARKEPKLRSSLIPLLAGRENAVTVAELRELYLSGCPKGLLTAGAGEKTAASWNQAIQELFPGLAALPEPMERLIHHGGGKRGAMVIQTTLAALTGILTTVLFAVMGSPGVFTWGLLVAVWGLLAAGCLVARAVVREENGRKFLLYLAVAFAPGFVIAAGMLIFSLI